MANNNTKVIVITGCSSGIGFHTALLLAKERGYKVFATMRNLAKSKALEKAAGNTLNKTMFIKELDISKEDSILKFVTATLKSEGRIDVLINNAAFGQVGSFESVSLEQMQALFQTNFFGTVRLTQECVRKMKEQRSGKIIFISSLAGFLPFPFGDFYVASKFAIEGLVLTLAPLLQTYNISVSTIQPGPVETSFINNISENKQGGITTPENQPEGGSSDAQLQSMQQKFMEKQLTILQKDMQTSDEVAEVIKKCVKDEKPNVRIQTSKFVYSMASEMLVDPTGNKTTKAIASLLQ